jgi:hypothetical protein
LLFGSQLHGFGLVVVVMAATACDNQNLDRLGGMGREHAQTSGPKSASGKQKKECFFCE